MASTPRSARQAAHVLHHLLDEVPDGLGRGGLGGRFERAHVARHTRHAEQARFTEQQRLDLVGRHAARAHQVQHHGRIDVAAARAHGEAVERRKSHRGGHRAALRNAAHRGAVAQVRDDHAPLRQLGRRMRQLRHDGFVRKPMEAVAPNARVVQRARQCEAAVDLGLHRVKGSVEARHLRHALESGHGRTHAGQVVRLVQRRQRLEFGQCFEHLRIDAHRRHEIRAAMHDAVADAGNAPAVALLRMPLEQRRERALVRGLRAVERGIVQGLALCIAHAQPRLQSRAQAVGLARPQRRRQDNTACAIDAACLIGRIEQRDLDRRRSGVESQQRIGHGWFRRSPCTCRGIVQAWPARRGGTGRPARGCT
jgi:hypothetical protein